MKILHVAQSYFPALGGVEGLTRNLSEQLVRDYGDRVTVFTSANPNAESLWRGKWPLLPVGVEMIDGVAVRRFRVFSGLQRLRGLLARGSHRLRLPGNDWLRTIETGPIVRTWPQAIAATDDDVIMATSFPFMHMYYAGAAAATARKPLVLLGAIHTADPWGYDRANMLTLIRRADAYLALSEHERAYLVARGVEPGRVHVSGGGVHLDAFAHADGADLRRAQGWGDDPLILAVARQSVLKRLDLVIQAMPAVWAAQPRARLVLAGAATSYTPTLEAMIRDLPAAQQARITLLHNFDEAFKPQLLAACDLLVHPSVNESFAIVLVEAWACGKPVIGVDQGAIPSIIRAGEDGLVFHYPAAQDLARQIVRVLEQPDLAARLGAAGKSKVTARYTWPAIAAQVREVYAQVIAATARRKS